MACCMLLASPQLPPVLQVTAVPLKYLVLPAAVVVAPAMPVDSQAMQLKGWEIKLKVRCSSCQSWSCCSAGVCDWLCLLTCAMWRLLTEGHHSSCQRYHAV